MKALLALALVAALAAGCTDSTGGPVTPQQDAQGNYVIHMPNNQFSPREAKVPVGANVTWVHDGGAPHNVVESSSPPAFSSDVDLGRPITSKGDAYTRQFTTAGTYSYFCAYHTGMEATLTVGA